MQDVVAKILAAGRDRIAAIAEANGLTTVPSATNFAAVDCKMEHSPQQFSTVSTGGDIFVRKPGAPVLDRCIRVSACGTMSSSILKLASPAALEDARKHADTVKLPRGNGVS